MPIKKHPRVSKMEQVYQQVFTPPFGTQPISDNTSLAQPSPLLTVPTIVTYNGAFEAPILANGNHA